MAGTRPDKARDPRKRRKQKTRFFVEEKRGKRRRITEAEANRRFLLGLPTLAIGTGLGIVALGAAASAAAGP